MEYVLITILLIISVFLGYIEGYGKGQDDAVDWLEREVRKERWRK